MCKTDKVACFATIYFLCGMHPRHESGLVSYPLIPGDSAGKERPRKSTSSWGNCRELAEAVGRPGILL